MRKIYYKVCKKCGSTVYLDEIDYMFDGCQDEYLVCKKCNDYIFVKVRYGKISRVTRKTMED